MRCIKMSTGDKIFYGIDCTDISTFEVTEDNIQSFCDYEYVFFDTEENRLLYKNKLEEIELLNHELEDIPIIDKEEYYYEV